MIKLKGNAVILGAILGLSIVGARLQSNYLLYIMLGLICLFVTLVAFDKVDKKAYPYALFIIGLSLLYQTTLMSNGLVGTDIHSEYYYYQLAVNNGWDTSITSSYNSCIGTVLLAPAIHKAFMLDGIWIFKVIYPLLFAFVAPLLYLVFKKQFNDKTSFLAVFFFISIPVWSIEMIGLPRQMLGELALVISIFLIVASNIKMRIRVPLLTLCVILGGLFHYVMWPTILLYLGASLTVALFFKRRVFPTRGLLLTVVILVGVGTVWYTWVGSGHTLDTLLSVFKSSASKIGNIPATVISPAAVSPPAAITSPTTGIPDIIPGFLSGNSPFVQIAFGLDFIAASITGKIFRIFQYATQILLAVGCMYIFVRHKRYIPEYLGLCIASILLASLAIFVPGTVTVIDTTRIYHLVLLFLSPAVIVGGLLVFRNYKLLTLLLILPYFIFTSGIVFEATKCEDVSSINIPYSIALSHERVNVAAVYSDNDIAVRDWATEHKCEPMFLDINGQLIMTEITGGDKWHHIVLEDTSLIKDGLALFPQSSKGYPDKCYIYLREWNIENGKVTFKPGWYRPKGEKTGMRISHTFEELGLDKILEESQIIYRKGDAIIYERKD